METYTDFGVSYPIQAFVNEINMKLWNDRRDALDCLDLYYFEFYLFSLGFI